jgi:Protein of unknown function (DUF1203)
MLRTQLLGPSMSQILVQGIPTAYVDAIRGGGPDANGQAALAQVSRGLGNPCRHCLGLIEDGDQKLVLSYRPFTSLQPYAETGPIFLHQAACSRYEARELPAWFSYMDPALIRGYDQDDWIRYETGQVVRGSELAEAVSAILAREDVAYVHVRSKFNCFQCRVDRT